MRLIFFFEAQVSTFRSDNFLCNTSMVRFYYIYSVSTSFPCHINPCQFDYMIWEGCLLNQVHWEVLIDLLSILNRF